MQPNVDSVSVEAPLVRLKSLDAVWFQVAGTVCNLRCSHCFISCSPDNDKFEFLSLETCKRYLEESAALGAKEYYFTGGEPFANPQMCDILSEAVRYGPATVLTNATLFRESTLGRLRMIYEQTSHPIEMRVSIDGYNAEMNDAIRGRGSFDAAMAGVRDLAALGFQPIITITRTWEGDDKPILAEFASMLKRNGYARPRLKVLPSLKLGAEVSRTRGYHDAECVTPEMLEGYDLSRLVCSSARVVTDRGVWVCPILLDSPEAKLGESLSEAMREYPLRHNACHTCWVHGAICTNVCTPACPTADECK